MMARPDGILPSGNRDVSPEPSLFFGFLSPFVAIRPNLLPRKTLNLKALREGPYRVCHPKWGRVDSRVVNTLLISLEKRLY
jgi:hypothetical protein